MEKSKKKQNNSNFEQYLQNLWNGSGYLAQNNSKKTERHPDMKGMFKLNDKIYQLSCWKKDKGKFSLKVSLRGSNQDESNTTTDDAENQEEQIENKDLPF